MSSSTRRPLSVPSSTVSGRTVTGGNAALSSPASATVSLGLVGVATSSSIPLRSRSNGSGAAPSSAGHGVVRRLPSATSQTTHHMSASASTGSSVSRGMPLLAPIGRQQGLADPTFPSTKCAAPEPSDASGDKESAPSCRREVVPKYGKHHAAVATQGSGGDEVTIANNGKANNAVNLGVKGACSSSSSSPSSQTVVLSVNAKNILRDIERFDFGGKLDELMRELGEESGGDGNDQGNINETYDEKHGDGEREKGQNGEEIAERTKKPPVLIPTPPRAARRPGEAGSFPSRGQSSPATHGSSSHEIACGGDEPLPLGDEKELPVRDAPPPRAVGGGGDGPLGGLRPANLPGLNVSERARQQNALSYFDDENPDVIVMAQKVTLLDNYSKIGGPLWEDNEERAASVGGRPHSAAASHRAFLAAQSGARHTDEQLRACANFCARASKKGLYFHHIVGELRERERTLLLAIDK